MEQNVWRSRWGTVHIEGDRALLDRPGVAIIGSRRATHEGRDIAASLAAELAHSGIVVISGLAAGIDGVAHEAAMHAGGRTIAVIGTSLDSAYPREHASLQARIARDHLVVSPFASGTPTAPWHFPKRNRLMALLAQATVLVEASATSGTRHQVTACASLGRPIFVRAPLVDRLAWLNTPGVRCHVRVWREPSEATRLLAEHLSAD
jgi:DNA processing protein